MKLKILKRSFLFLLALVGLSLFSSRPTFASTTGTLLPTADGTYRQWTIKSGATHYTMVDEAVCNGTTDHNQTSTVGERDSYVIDLSSIPNNSVITAIQVTPCASRINNGGITPIMNVFYRFNGVNSADAGSYALSGTSPTVLAPTVFSSLSHTKIASSSVEIGAILTSGAKGARLSQVATVITYNAPVAPTATTNDATALASNGATLNSTVNPNGFSTTVRYRYGTSNVGCASLPTQTSSTFIGSGTGNVSPIPRLVSGLTSNTEYFFCAVANNIAGTTYGNVLSFTTLP